MWWLWTFFGTIIFAFIYYIHYEFKAGPSSDQELSADLAAIEQLKTTAKADAPKVDLATVLGDPNKIQVGAGVFAGKCASCHGDKGQGLVGPNLTDKAWIHGAKPEQILTVISKGVLDKGMPPWDGILKEDEIHGLIAYIDSIKGTNPPGAKAPQGEEIPDYY
jgi:cytochrome c oxidase cbb3-type subunit 3